MHYYFRRSNYNVGLASSLPNWLFFSLSGLPPVFLFPCRNVGVIFVLSFPSSQFIPFWSVTRMLEYISYSSALTLLQSPSQLALDWKQPPLSWRPCQKSLSSVQDEELCQRNLKSLISLPYQGCLEINRKRLTSQWTKKSKGYGPKIQYPANLWKIGEFSFIIKEM